MKELDKLISRVKNENRAFSIKVSIRKNKGKIYKIGVYRHLNGGGKESRTLALTLVDKKASSVQNRNNIEIALALRSKLQAELSRSEISGKGFSINIDLKTDDFLVYFKRIELEKSNQPNYRICREHLETFIGKDRLPFSSLSSEICRKFAKYLNSCGRSARTAHNYLICFKSAINSAINDDYIEKNPARNVRVKFHTKEKKALNIEQLRKLYKTECKNEQLKNAFLFSCYTGLRKSDIINLKRSDVSGGYVSIITQKTKTKVKNKLTNTMQIILKGQEKLLARSEQYHKRRGSVFDRDRLFVFPTGGKSTEYLRDWFRKAKVLSDDELDKNPYTFHTARHTFVSNLVNYHGNIAVAKELAGHRDISTTQIYSHLQQDVKDKAVESLPELF